MLFRSAYANYTDEQMMLVRKEEQRQAAIVGRFGAMVQLDYPSGVAKDAGDSRLRDDLRAILAATRPRVVYTHNPADKHDTHIAVVVPVIQAIRDLPRAQRPQAVHGCEVWRDLDWLGDAEKVVHDVGRHDNLAAAINGIFDSQIAGGKRYDLAVMGVAVEGGKPVPRVQWIAPKPFTVPEGSNANGVLDLGLISVPTAAEPRK